MLLLGAWVAFRFNATYRAKVGTFEITLVIVPIIISIFSITSDRVLEIGLSAVLPIVSIVYYTLYFVHLRKR